MSKTRTFEEINEKIKGGKAVVVTAEELIEIVKEDGVPGATKKVDVVTTGTFGPMCSSGAILNVGHPIPRMKFQKAWINSIEAYCGIAAVDLYLGATQIPDDDPANRSFPGPFKYGGAHVIHELVAGNRVNFRAVSYGTDCYPRKEFEGSFTLEEINQAALLNPRNAYQNYNVAVNKSDERTIYTYMGVLKPDFGNANYCSAGQLSPLLKDPTYRTIGIGSRIFLGGGVGYVYWEGTQHNPSVPRTDFGAPLTPAGSLAVTGDLKKMSPDWIVGYSALGYGVSLLVGLGVPIPVLDEEICNQAATRDEELFAPVVDYSDDYPNCKKSPYGSVSYAELRSGSIKVEGKEVPTASLSSYAKAREIAKILKSWIENGEFLISEPVAGLPGIDSGQGFKMFPTNHK